MCGTYRGWDDLVFNVQLNIPNVKMKYILVCRIGSVPSCSQAALLCLKNGLIVIIDF